MDKERLFDLINGFFAWDQGATDSGIRDEDSKKEVLEYLRSLTPKKLTIIMYDYLKEYFMNPEAIEAGYTFEDVNSFCEWFIDDFHGRL